MQGLPGGSELPPGQEGPDLELRGLVLAPVVQELAPDPALAVVALKLAAADGVGALLERQQLGEPKGASGLGGRRGLGPHSVCRAVLLVLHKGRLRGPDRVWGRGWFKVNFYTNLSNSRALMKSQKRSISKANTV